MQHDGLAAEIVRQANEAYTKGEALPVHSITILLDRMHHDIHKIPEETALLIYNGNHHRSKRERARALALPVVGGGGVGTVLLLNLLSVLGKL